MRYFIAGLCIVFILGCAHSSNPVAPTDTSGDSITPTANSSQSGGKFSLGYYEVTLDPVAQSAEIVPLRGADFRANITVFLQPPLGHLGWIEFSNFDISDFDTEGIIRLDIAVTHPFAGIMDLRGFDTLGVFMADAIFIPDFPPGGVIPRQDGSDAVILNADGYTRWNNAVEFTADNIFGYFAGNYGIPGYTPSATVNGYKYHCTGIGTDEDIVDFFSDPGNIGHRGSFTPGDVSKRRYEILFPDPHGNLLFQYNVLTCWDAPSTSSNPDISDYPLTANMFEPFLLVADTSESTLFYEDESTYGGTLHIDLTVYDWQAMDVDGGGIEVADGIQGIYIDNFGVIVPVSSGNLLPSATILEDGPVSSTFSIDITNVSPTAAGEEWFVIAVQSAEPDSYDQGFPVPVAPDPLAAYCMTKVTVLDESPLNQQPGVGAISGETEPWEINTEEYTVAAMDPEGDPMTFEWSLVDDGLAADWGNIGIDSDTINIDWNLYGVGDYDLHCRVKDDYNPWQLASNNPLDIHCIEEPPNQPPEVGDITGETNPLESDVEEYTVTATDPESDPLTYEWSLVDDGAAVDWGNVGSDSDAITIDWMDHGPGDFDLYCHVKDAENPWVPASNNPLDITVEPITVTCGNGVFGYLGYAWTDCDAVEAVFLSDGTVLIQYMIGASLNWNWINNMHVMYETDIGGYCYYVGDVEPCEDDWCRDWSHVFDIDNDGENQILHMDCDPNDTWGAYQEEDDVVAFVLLNQPTIIRFIGYINNNSQTPATEITNKAIPSGTVIAIDFDEAGDLWVLGSTGQVYELDKAGTYSITEMFTVDMDTLTPGTTVVFDWAISYLTGDLFVFTDETTGGTIHKVSGSTGSIVDTVSNALDAGNSNPAYGLGNARGDIEIDHRIFAGEASQSEHCRLVVSGGPGGTSQGTIFARYDQSLNMLSTWNNNQLGGGSCNNPASNDGGRFIIFDPIDHVDDPGQPGDEESWDHTLWVGDSGQYASAMVWATSCRPCPADW